MEKCGVAAKLDEQRATEATAQIADDVADHTYGAVRIVDVAGAILDPQDLSRLGEVSQQRVVARVLRVVRIVAAPRPGDLESSAQDRAIEIDGGPAKAQSGDPLDDEIAVQTGQRGDGSSCEALEPVRHGASRRDAHQVAEAPEERIVGDILQMLQPPAADEKQSVRSRPAPGAACRNHRPGLPMRTLRGYAEQTPGGEGTGR